MQNIHGKLKLHRGSSPNGELRDGFVDWVNGLPVLANEEEQSKRDSGMKSKGHVGRTEKEPDHEGQWQDDGGEGGLAA